MHRAGRKGRKGEGERAREGGRGAGVPCWWDAPTSSSSAREAKESLANLFVIVLFLVGVVTVIRSSGLQQAVRGVVCVALRCVASTLRAGDRRVLAFRGARSFSSVGVARACVRGF